MDFKSAISYLDYFVSYEQKRDFDYGEKAFDLKRIENFLKKCEIDYSKIKFVHVAGSKGKGSVSTMTADYLKEKGHMVGLFTSPHILSITERVKINGDCISEEDFALQVSDLRAFIERFGGTDLTYFELLLVLALKFFVEVAVEYAVLEVGLGGRLDATNIVVPEVSVLTTVELEHTDVLGNDLGSILTEKMGIKKAGVPMVVAKQSDEVMAILEKRSSEELIFVDGEKNEDTVREIVKALFANVDDGLLGKVIDDFKLLGRFDIRQLKGKTVVFDMAHTEKSMSRLADLLKMNFSEKKFVFLVSIMKGKQVQEIFEVIRGLAEKVVFTLSHEERSLSVQELQSKYIGDSEVEEDSVKAFEELLSDIKKDQVLVITGSHFLVSRLLSALPLS